LKIFYHHHVSTRGCQAMASHTCDLMRLIWSTMASRVLEENVVEAEEPANTVVKDTVFLEGLDRRGRGTICCCRSHRTLFKNMLCLSGACETLVAYFDQPFRPSGKSLETFSPNLCHTMFIIRPCLMLTLLYTVLHVLYTVAYCLAVYAALYHIVFSHSRLAPQSLA